MQSVPYEKTYLYIHCKLQFCHVQPVSSELVMRTEKAAVIKEKNCSMRPLARSTVETVRYIGRRPTANVKL